MWSCPRSFAVGRTARLRQRSEVSHRGEPSHNSGNSRHLAGANKNKLLAWRENPVRLTYPLARSLGSMRVIVGVRLIEAH
jgi:hypothetical protein